MKQRLYTIYDDKAKTYYKPFNAENDATASRMIANEANTKDSQIAANPADYSLFSLGEFNTDTAIYLTYAPVLVTHCSTLIKESK